VHILQKLYVRHYWEIPLGESAQCHSVEGYLESEELLHLRLIISEVYEDLILLDDFIRDCQQN
jgi:hypothetical protein